MAKKGKKTTMKVTRHVGAMAKQHIARGTPLKFLLEAIVNSLDEYPPSEDMSAGECLVDILVSHGKFLRVKDEADGFGTIDVKGFLNYFESKKAGDLTKTGRIGSGRSFAFSFCKGIEVWSRSSDFPGFVHFILREEHLTGDEESEVEIETDCSPPDFWDLEGNGTIISLLDVNWKRVHSVERLGNELSKALSKFASEVVRLNGKRLPERKHVKEPLRDTAVHDHLGGLCRWDLYIPAQAKGEIKLGGRLMPIIGINAFLDKMDPALVATLPEVLTSGVVGGDILVPGLNKYRHTDSENLSPDVYDKFAIDVFALLVRIGSEAQEYFAVHEEEQARKANETFLHQLADKANKAQGISPDPICGDSNFAARRSASTASRAPFIVTPRDLALVRGTSVPTYIQGYARTSGNFDCRVEDADAGCVTVSKVGPTEFLVTAESEGEATLVYFDMKDAAKQVQSAVKVVKKSGLQLTPLSATIAQGGSGRAAIAHPEQLKPGQVPKYSVVGAPAGTIRTTSRARGGRRSVGIEVTQKCPPGTYTVVAEIPGTPLRAECTRTIVEAEPDGLVTPWVLEDCVYRVQPTQFEQSVLALVMGEQWQATSPQPIREIRVKMNHPILELAKNGDRELLVLDAVINAHLDAQEVDPAERMTRYDALRTGIYRGIRSGK